MPRIGIDAPLTVFEAGSDPVTAAAASRLGRRWRMGGARGRRQANRNEARRSLQAEVLVVHDPELRRRQLTAIRNLLVTLGSRVGEPPTSDVGVGGGAVRERPSVRARRSPRR